MNIESLAMKTEQDYMDYLRGGIDCKKGVPHVEGSEWYNRGYSHEYAKEQEEAHKSERFARQAR